MSTRPPSYVSLPDSETSQASQMPLGDAMEPIPEVVDRTSEATTSVDSQDPLRLEWHPPNSSTAGEGQPHGRDDHHVPFGAPPRYTRAERPESNVTYSLCAAGSPSTYLLVPSADSPNTRPKFHITVGMDLMNHFSSVTTIRQGGTENGRFVGEFETGHPQLTSKTPDCITFGDLRRRPITDVLNKEQYSTYPRVKLTYSGKPHRWVYNKQKFYWWFSESIMKWRCCATAETSPNLQVQAKLYASYSSSRRELEVTPEAHDFLDQILISLLIVERRLAPRFPWTRE
ncbi:hypothetical protein D9758_015440 [Tetrapyrgos nigripes]|uniref:DUF6593 domain-containing protein n=1 Tax=Tetrapyrgos nigripes TaxID=182062 RepID=A0A8H5CKV8_9AGAR|nr:hypothetical protein D9758_015440 [Tetrapyrgos nigripes]